MTGRWAPFVALLLLSGCVTEIVQERRPRKGPVAAVGYVDPGGGEVRYSTEGWGLVISARRATALRRMRHVCKPLRPSIIREFTNDDVDVAYNEDDLESNMKQGGDHYQVSPYHHIVFECLTPAPPRPAAAPKAQPAPAKGAAAQAKK